MGSASPGGTIFRHKKAKNTWEMTIIIVSIWFWPYLLNRCIFFNSAVTGDLHIMPGHYGQIGQNDDFSGSLKKVRRTSQKNKTPNKSEKQVRSQKNKSAE